MSWGTTLIIERVAYMTKNCKLLLKFSKISRAQHGCPTNCERLGLKLFAHDFLDFKMDYKSMRIVGEISFLKLNAPISIGMS